jgi:hypothetical protein
MFSALIYVIGYKLRAGESEWNEMQFVDVIPKGNTAELRGTTYGSLYSPVNASYKLGGRQRFAAIRGEYLGAVANRSTEGEVGLSGDQYQALVDVPVWTSQSFIGQWLDEGPMPFTASVKPIVGAQDFELAITNRELPPGATGRVAVGRRIHDFKLPERNQTTTLPLPGNGGRALNDFANGASTWFYQAAAQRNQGFGSDEARLQLQPAEASMAITLARHIDHNRNQQWGQYSGNFMTPGSLELSALLDREFAVIMIWCEDYAPTGPMNEFTPRRTARSSLLRLAVPLNSKDN